MYIYIHYILYIYTIYCIYTLYTVYIHYIYTEYTSHKNNCHEKWQNVDELSYHTVRGLYFLAVVLAASIH